MLCVFHLVVSWLGLDFPQWLHGAVSHTGRPLRESTEAILVGKFGFILKPTLGPYL